MPHGHFVFVDETGVNLDSARTHARAPRGQRALDTSVPRNTPTRTGLVGAMGAEGMICSMQVAGAVDGAAFLVFLEEVLGPHLKKGDFVVLGQPQHPYQPQGRGRRLRPGRLPALPAALLAGPQPH